MIDFNGNGKIDSGDHYIGYQIYNDMDKQQYATSDQTGSKKIGLFEKLMIVLYIIVAVVSPLICVISLFNSDFIEFKGIWIFWLFTLSDVVIAVICFRNKKAKK